MYVYVCKNTYLHKNIYNIIDELLTAQNNKVRPLAVITVRWLDLNRGGSIFRVIIKEQEYTISNTYKLQSLQWKLFNLQSEDFFSSLSLLVSLEYQTAHPMENDPPLPQQNPRSLEKVTHVNLWMYILLLKWDR